MATFQNAVQPIASVLVVGFRDAPLLGRCLESLADVVTVPFEVIIVLNDPTPEVVLRLDQTVIGAQVFTFRANLGFGGAVNFAAKQAKGSYVVLLNDDCTVNRGWLESLIDTVERRQDCGIVGSTYLHPDGTLQEAGQFVWSDGTTAGIGDGKATGYMQFERIVDYCSGGSLLVRRELWDELGGMDDVYAPAYYEDVDLCLRAAQAGWKTWYQPHSVVVHQRSSSTNPGFRGFLMARNREKFCARWSEVLATRDQPGVDERSVWKAMGCPIRVLVIDDRIPDAARGSGMGRMYDALTELANDSGIYVAFHPRLPPERASAGMPIPGVRLVVDLESHLDKEGVKFDVVVVSRPDNFEIYRQLIDERLSGVPVIYDAEALFHRRLEMQAGLSSQDRRVALLTEAASMRELEASLMQRADHVVCISETEGGLARTMCSTSNTSVHIVEPWLRLPDPSEVPFERRSHIGFVAGWLAGPESPNVDGLRWFATEVLPRVRSKVPGCRLLVTGSSPPSTVAWLQGAAVEFVGGLRDLTSFYDSVRVAISPTRFGAGVKLKTVEALQSGVPVVSTPEGAAGLPRGLREAVWVSHDPVGFADSVAALLQDRITWERQRKLCLAARAAEAINESGVGRWPALIQIAHSARKAMGALA